ncbi:MAG: SPOR domain-containing protein [Spirochaetes bacterium]|nr:SPOR domain-containing protein [Spirochaetota bacterium]
MKKTFIIIFIFISLINLNSSDLKITDIEKPDKLYGTVFFPLFVGAKWKWQAEGFGNVTEINWEIVSSHKIESASKNIKDIIAFRMVSKEFFDEWYVFEFDGYICFFNEFTNEIIERKIPLDPKLDDQWNNDKTKCNVAEIKEDTVKIEYIDPENNRYGYEIYKKNAGPFKKFENISRNDEKKDFFMTVIENNSFRDSITKDTIAMEEKKDFIDEEIKTLETKKDIETMPESNTMIKDESDTKKEEVIIKKDEKTYPDKEEIIPSQLNESEIIKELTKDKNYIQIGAFNVIYYAKNLIDKAKTAGFEAKVFYDKDGYYKILIITSKDPKEIIDEIKKNINKDAFIKRIK